MTRAASGINSIAAAPLPTFDGNSPVDDSTVYMRHRRLVGRIVALGMGAVLKGLAARLHRAILSSLIR